MQTLTLNVADVKVLTGRGMDRILLEIAEKAPFTHDQISHEHLCVEFKAERGHGTDFVQNVLGLTVGETIKVL